MSLDLVDSNSTGKSVKTGEKPLLFSRAFSALTAHGKVSLGSHFVFSIVFVMVSKKREIMPLTDTITEW